MKYEFPRGWFKPSRIEAITDAGMVLCACGAVYVLVTFGIVCASNLP